MEDLIKIDSLTLALNLGYKVIEKNTKFFMLKKFNHSLIAFKNIDNYNNISLISLSFKHLQIIENTELFYYEDNFNEDLKIKQIDIQQEFLEKLSYNNIIDFIFNLEQYRELEYFSKEENKIINSIDFLNQNIFIYNEFLAFPLFNLNEQVVDIIYFNKEKFDYLFDVSNSFFSFQKLEQQSSAILFFNPINAIYYFNKYPFLSNHNYIFISKNFYQTFDTIQIVTSYNFVDLVYSLNYFCFSANEYLKKYDSSINFYLTKENINLNFTYSKSFFNFLKIQQFFSDLLFNYNLFEVSKKFEIKTYNYSSTNKNNQINIFKLLCIKNKDLLFLILDSFKNFFQKNIDTFNINIIFLNMDSIIKKINNNSNDNLLKNEEFTEINTYNNEEFIEDND